MLLVVCYLLCAGARPPAILLLQCHSVDETSSNHSCLSRRRLFERGPLRLVCLGEGEIRISTLVGFQGVHREYLVFCTGGV